MSAQSKKSTDITPAMVKKIIAMRKKGATWTAILEEFPGKTKNFIIRVRKLMKETDPSLVRDLGPGSSSYGTKKKDAPKGTAKKHKVAPRKTVKKAASKKTSAKAASAASRVLRDKRTSKASKDAAAKSLKAPRKVAKKATSEA